MTLSINTSLAKRLIPLAATALFSAGLLTGCADDSNNVGGSTGGATTSGSTGGNTTSGSTGGNTTSGSTGGTTSGSTGGTTSGSTGGTTSGSTGGTTSGSTGGTTSGSTGGTTSGSTGGTTSGSTGGTTSGTTGGTTSGTTGGTTGGSTGGSTTGSTGGTTGSNIDCSPTSTTYKPLQTPTAQVFASTTSTCLLCNVANEQNVIDVDQTNFATLTAALGLLAARASVTVTTTDGPFVNNERVGFIAASPSGALLTANLLQNATVTTLRNGADVESANLATTLRLDLLGNTLLGGLPTAFLSFKTTQPFDGVRLDFGSLVAALGALNVSNACVSIGPGSDTAP